ncbi:2-polyprenyl-6-methoxyphenol hydroxylase [Paracoccus versutus]|uniref:2-polyprenyl-6-methoxyphenol hydroxylase-like FAD-dependent oxidoreductase n=1 Tax=Paracoccus versutus TaxID=34007 RepID=A0AAQ0KM12_PARVE|nr:FAD-dependent oxidoreductase [Paracoccus versutus]REG46443.1 2-polyprenyl-6-methoxyphenol hydroxylase-like FAD-dependent oxidoreductase [Paracoccus versutus]WEJ78522.1 2-polyprenyl-6-methoxyphenol hydroxylase [Paracoccus versutus]
MDTPVLIVGAGPIGLALAGDLGFRGTACTLVERSDGQILQPKMDMVGIRTMEFCRRWGIVPWVESAGYNRAYPQDCAWVTSLTGHEFGREVFPAPQDEKCPAQSPQKRERCPQNFFDPVLRRFASQYPYVSLRYRTELIGFVEDEDGVLSTLRDLESGETFEIRSQYLVGTDGGASSVRQALGIAMSGEPTLTYTTNVVFRTENLEGLHHLRPAYRYIFIGPEGTWATLVAINGRDQWRFSLVGDDRMQTHSEEVMRAAIIRAVGKEFDFEILSLLPWVRRQLVADSYGTKRVFLAGDAAHLTSPTGGFGMNTGIQDAVNLSWKLAATIEGWGGPNLLGSYEAEMRPVAIRNVSEATGNLKRMLSPRVVSPGPEMFADTPEAEQKRREFGEAYTELMKREWFSIGIHLGYMFEGSPIVIPDGTPRPEDTVQTYTPTSRPGSRAPHVWLEPGKSILDLFGKEFVLLRFGEDAPSGDGLATEAAARGVPFRVVAIDNAEAAALYERRLVLVRPDGQVVWRDDAAPARPSEIIDAVRGIADGQALGIRSAA